MSLEALFAYTKSTMIVCGAEHVVKQVLCIASNLICSKVLQQ